MLFMFKSERFMFKESRTFHTIRMVTATIVTTLWFAYVAFLIFQIWTDHPAIQIEQNYVDTIKVPDIEMCGYGSDIEIDRCDFIWGNFTSTQYPNCQRSDGWQYIFAGPRKDEKNFCYLFTVNNTLVYSRTNTTVKDPLHHIDFYFKIKNFTGAEVDAVTVPTIAIQLLDPDFNPLWNKTNLKTQYDKNADNDFRLQGNNFAGIFNQSTQVKFKQSKFRSIRNDGHSILGLTSQYDDTLLLDASPTYYPLHNSSNFTEEGLTGLFSVQCSSYLVSVQSEKRNRTVLAALGVGGGAFGAVCYIYIFLFGDPKTRPWGLMHQLIYSEVKNLVKNGGMPLLNPLTDIGKLDLTQDERIARLEDRIIELEGILADYFLDVTPMKRLQKRKAQQEDGQQESPEGIEMLDQKARTRQHFTFDNSQASGSQINVFGT